MRYFYAIVHKDDDSAFGVTFPDLPGCFSAADDESDLVANAAEAVSLWFEDRDADKVPPSGLARVKELAADDLANGAFVLSVPHIRNDTRVARVNVSLERGILDAIDLAAGERSLTRSAFIAQAARNEIERRP